MRGRQEMRYDGKTEKNKNITHLKQSDVELTPEPQQLASV